MKIDTQWSRHLARNSIRRARREGGKRAFRCFCYYYGRAREGKRELSSSKCAGRGGEVFIRENMREGCGNAK